MLNVRDGGATMRPRAKERGEPDRVRDVRIEEVIIRVRTSSKGKDKGAKDGDIQGNSIFQHLTITSYKA